MDATVTIEEVLCAMKTMKNGKNPGPDEVPVDLPKRIDEEHINMVVELSDKIYSTGTISREWLTSIFVCLPKEPNAKDLCRTQFIKE